MITERVVTAVATPLVVGAMAAAGIVIDEKTLLPIGTIGFLIGITYWLGRKVQRIDDKFESIEKSVGQVQTGVDNLEGQVGKMDRRIQQLPCSAIPLPNDCNNFKEVK